MEKIIKISAEKVAVIPTEIREDIHGNKVEIYKESARVIYSSTKIKNEMRQLETRMETLNRININEKIEELRISIDKQKQDINASMARLRLIEAEMKK